MIKGVHPGLSDLWIWKSDGSSEHRSIRVLPNPKAELPDPLARALGNLSETEVFYSGNAAVLRGEIRGLSELERIEALKKGFPNQVVDETEPSVSLIEQGLKRLENWLATSPPTPSLRLDREDRTLWLRLARGTPPSPSQRVQIEKRARNLYPAVQIDLDSLPDAAPTVLFKVFLLELKKSRFRSLGLSWPASQPSAFRVTTSSIQNLIQLDLTLEILEGEGALKVLSNPELVVRAPGEAELFSGGELPIRNTSYVQSSVSWRTFGLSLKLHVTHSAGNRVRLDIQTEVSHLDPTLALDKVPGIQANRMKTQVDAQYGKPLLLSGLLQQGMRKQAKGLPGLREIPILGALFGSEDYVSDKSELVAILVPMSEPPAEPMKRMRTQLEPAPATPQAPTRAPVPAPTLAPAPVPPAESELPSPPPPSSDEDRANRRFYNSYNGGL